MKIKIKGTIKSRAGLGPSSPSSFSPLSSRGTLPMPTHPTCVVRRNSKTALVALPSHKYRTDGALGLSHLQASPISFHSLLVCGRYAAPRKTVVPGLGLSAGAPPALWRIRPVEADTVGFRLRMARQQLVVASGEGLSHSHQLGASDALHRRRSVASSWSHVGRDPLRCLWIWSPWRPSSYGLGTSPPHNPLATPLWGLCQWRRLSRIDRPPHSPRLLREPVPSES